ncbi:NAD-dependent epimerase/dehydratase family protein [Eionea flava]
MTVPKEKIALLGFGDIANRLSAHLTDHELVGVKRSPLEHPTATITTADCCDAKEIQQVLSQGFDVLVMTFTPTEMSDAGYHQGYVAPVSNILHALEKQVAVGVRKPRLLLFVSSTSVYAQQDGRWIDEQSPTEPDSYSGQRLLEAERLIADSGYPYCHVRFSGIYGRGRGHVVEQVIAGKGSPFEPPIYTNRIHADDCAGVLAHLIHLSTEKRLPPVMIASDSHPAPLHEVKDWMRSALGLPENHFTECAPLAARTRRSNKRCRNQQLLDSGYVLTYPSFKEGYAPWLANI